MEDLKWTDLHQAVYEKNVDLVQAILMSVDTGFNNIRATDANGATPLHVAAREGHLDIVPLLVLEGADVNARDNHGYTPLLIASMKGHEKVVKTLLELGADVKACNEDGETVLHLTKDAIIARYLINDNADVNAKDQDGNSPLHYAVMENNKELIDVLLDNGADPEIINNEGIAALDISKERGHEETLGQFQFKKVGKFLRRSFRRTQKFFKPNSNEASTPEKDIIAELEKEIANRELESSEISTRIEKLNEVKKSLIDELKIVSEEGELEFYEKIANLTMERKKLMNEKDEIQRLIQDDIEKYGQTETEREIMVWVKGINSLGDQIRELQEQAERKDKRMAELNDRLQAIIIKKDEEILKLNENLNEMQSKINQLKEENKKLSKVNEKQSKIIGTQKRRIKLLLNENGSLYQQLKDKDREFQSLVSVLKSYYENTREADARNVFNGALQTKNYNIGLNLGKTKLHVA